MTYRKPLEMEDIMKYLSNAFSLQMVKDFPTTVKVEEVSPSNIPEEAVSCIGHIDTASVVGNILKRDVPVNRVNVTLERGDELFVAQLTGGRLPEGSTTLPEGFKLKFLKVCIID